MNTTEIYERIGRIAAAAAEGDGERAHGAHDRLMADVLHAIAAGAADPVALARAALAAEAVTYERHCA